MELDNEKAYFYSYLIARGRSDRNSRIIFKIKEVDMIEKVEKFFLKNKIHFGWWKSDSSFYIRNEFIKSIGYSTIRKEKKIGFDGNKKEIIRGIVDSLWTQNAFSIQHNTPKLNISQNTNIVMFVANSIRSELGISCSIDTNTTKKRQEETRDEHYTITYEGEDCLKIVKWLYEEADFYKESSYDFYKLFS